MADIDPNTVQAEFFHWLSFPAFIEINDLDQWEPNLQVVS